MPRMESPPGAETVIDGRRYLYFAGTGYLGLQGHPAVIQAACDAVTRYGVGSATSRPLAGDTPPVLEVERRAAEFLASESAFYCASGYLAPAVVTVLLAERVDRVFIDEHAHHSLRHAAMLPGVPVHRFAHCDPAVLAAELGARVTSEQRPLVMTDGVFSALGTTAPLADYVGVLREYAGSMLLVDDAHGVGVLGGHGRGCVEYADLACVTTNTFDAAVPQLWMCGTLSKALGGFGGIVPGSREVIERIKAATPFGAGASGPAVPVAAASAKALEVAAAQPELRQRLRENVARLKSGLRQLGFQVDATPVPIVALRFDTAEAMRHIQTALAERGLWIAYLPAYSGVGPEGVLRLAVFATHAPEMIDQLLGEMQRVV